MKPAKVPNDVQREDQILPFVTLKQLVLLLIGGGISYLLYTQLSQTYELNEVQQTLIWIPLALAALFGYFKVKGMTLMQFIFLLIEQAIRNPRHRHWVQNGGSTSVSMVSSVTLPEDKNKKKEQEVVPQKIVHQRNIESIATLIDQS